MAVFFMGVLRDSMRAQLIGAQKGSAHKRVVRLALHDDLQGCKGDAAAKVAKDGHAP
jgi:hypothetical protein